MTAPNSLNIKVLAAFAAVYFAWGSTFLAIRFAVESMPPFIMAGFRFLAAGAVLYVWARFRGATLPSMKQWLSAALIGFLLLVCGNGAVVIAEKTVPSGMVSLLIAMVPVYFALLEWLSPGGKAPSAKTIAGLSLGVFGLIMLVNPFKLSASASSLDLGGVCIVLAGSFAWSLGSMYSRSVKLSESPTMGLAMQTLAGGVLLTFISVLANEPKHLDLSLISMRSYLSLVYLIVFGSLIGFSAYVFLLKTVKPTQVATYAYVNPVVAVILGWLFAGERLNSETVLASAVILAAV